MTTFQLDQAERLLVLQRTGLLDSPVEETFERLTRAVMNGANVPTALVSLVDDTRQFFKSAQGLGEPWASRRETPLTHSFCQYVVTGDDMLVVEDARTDERVAGNLAIEEIGVIAYAGAPVHGPDGMPLGSLCAIDSNPRSWTAEELRVVQDVAALTTELIVMRASALSARAVALDLSHQLRSGLAAAQLELDDLPGGERVTSLLVGLEDVVEKAVRRLGEPKVAGDVASVLSSVAGADLGEVADAQVKVACADLGPVIREMVAVLGGQGQVRLGAVSTGALVRITAAGSGSLPA